MKKQILPIAAPLLVLGIWFYWYSSIGWTSTTEAKFLKSCQKFAAQSTRDVNDQAKICSCVLDYAKMKFTTAKEGISDLYGIGNFSRKYDCESFLYEDY